MTRLLGSQYQAFGMCQKTPSRRSQAGAGTVADKQPRLQLAFQALNACADGGLSQMQLAGGLQKTAGGRNGKKGPGLFNIDSSPLAFVHLISNISILDTKKYRFTSIIFRRYSSHD